MLWERLAVIFLRGPLIRRNADSLRPILLKNKWKRWRKIEMKTILAAKLFTPWPTSSDMDNNVILMIYYLSVALYRAPLKLTFQDCPVKDKSQNLCLFCFILTSSSAQALHLRNLILCKCALLIRSSFYIHSFIPWIFNDKLLKRSELSLFCSLLCVQLQEQYLTVSPVVTEWMNERTECQAPYWLLDFGCTFPLMCQDSTTLLDSLTSIRNIHVPEQCLILFNLQVPFFLASLGGDFPNQPWTPKITFITSIARLMFWTKIKNRGQD